MMTIIKKCNKSSKRIPIPIFEVSTENIEIISLKKLQSSKMFIFKHLNF